MVGLACNIEPIGVAFRSILESTIEASEAALIGDTRQKELFYLETSPSTSVDFFNNLFRSFLSRIFRLSPKTKAVNKKIIKSHHLYNR